MTKQFVLLVILTTVLFIVAGLTSVSAQDFSSILKKLNKIENRLNKLKKETKDAATKQDKNQPVNAEQEQVASNENIPPVLKSSVNNDEVVDEGLNIGQLEISGFFDILYLIPEDAEAEMGFALGQLEINIESSVSPYISASGALAYGDGVMEVGAAFVDLHWMGAEITHPVHSEAVDHSGLIIGQFDVPFGADYQIIASPDRALITPPLAVEHTIDGWNDLGLIMYGGHEKWEAQGFLVNGDQDNMAYGGRLTVNFSEYFNVGGSYATVLDRDNNPQVNFFGGDITVNYEPFEVTAEYLVKQDSVQVNQWDMTGYYVEAKIGLSNWFNKDVYAIGGYSEVQTKHTDIIEITEKINRITAGIGYNITDNASARFEYMADDGDNIEKQYMAIAQFVVAF